MGVTRAILREFGKVPREREWLIRFEIIGAIKSAMHFNTFAENDFRPLGLFFNLFMQSITS